MLNYLTLRGGGIVCESRKFSSPPKIKKHLKKLRKHGRDIGTHGKLGDLVVTISSNDLAAIQIPLDVLVRQIIKVACSKKKFCEHLAIVISKEVVRKHKIDLRKFKHYIESREIEKRWKF